MGEIHIFNLKNNWKDWDYFIETGTGQGESLVHAKSLPFHKLWSFEIHKEVYKVTEGFSDYRTRIMNVSSVEGLRLVLPLIKPDEKILFWLDAHFPGADYLHEPYICEGDINLPLYKELEIINEYREDCKDDIYIDDVQLYDKNKLASYMKNHDFTIKRIGEYYGFYTPNEDTAY